MKMALICPPFRKKKIIVLLTTYLFGSGNFVLEPTISKGYLYFSFFALLSMHIFLGIFPWWVPDLYSAIRMVVMVLSYEMAVKIEWEEKKSMNHSVLRFTTKILITKERGTDMKS